LTLTLAGAKIAGHRGFFLIDDGVDLNQALINYGLDFLRTKGYKKVQAPFFMKKEAMAKTAQLSVGSSYRRSGWPSSH
jgi:seryl-tRNA synthetase